MKLVSLEESINTHQFLRDSIFQFVSIILLAYISFNGLQFPEIGLVIELYTGYTISKFIIWLMVSKDLPHTHGSNPLMIRLKTILLIDFYEAWKLDKIKNYSLKPVFAMVFNCLTLTIIIFTVIFIEDFLNYSLLMIQVADSREINQWLSLLCALLLISMIVSSNLSYINIFMLNQGYTMNSTRFRLSLIYLFCIHFSQAFLIQQLFSLNDNIGSFYVLFRLILAITFGLWIGIMNPAAISKANFMFSNSNSVNAKKQHMVFVLFMSIFSGQTIDIAPFYRSISCEYDKFISHQTVSILRVISTLESIAALILPGIYQSTEGLEYFSSIFIVVIIINSITVFFHCFYGVTCILQRIKYPRCREIQVNNLRNIALQMIETVKQQNRKDYQSPLLDNYFDIQFFSKNCFQSNPFLEKIEFIGDYSPDMNSQPVIDVMIGLWRDPKLQNSQINLHNQPVMVNCCEVSHLFLTNENIHLILESMRINSMIQYRKNLFVTVHEAFSDANMQQFIKILLKHVLEINSLSILTEPDSNSEKYNPIIRQFETAKVLSIRHICVNTCYFKIIAQFMSFNPHFILYDLYE